MRHRRLAGRISALGGALAVAVLAVALIAAKPLTRPQIVESIGIVTQPFDLDRKDAAKKAFGKLEWRGGMILSSNSRHFGGFSGLALSPDGSRLLAVSDAGVWLGAEIERDGRAFRGLTNARLGPLLALNGKPLPRTRDIDAEGLSVADGSAWIAYEQNHRVMRHDFAWGDDGPGRAAQRIAPPAGFGPGGGNTGMEAVAALTDGPLRGRLAIFAENRTDGRGGLKGWIVDPKGAAARPLFLKRIGGFDITDAAALPGGGIVVLERRFRYSEGVQMRIRRISVRELEKGGEIEGETLIALDQRWTIDNMEGIAAHRAEDGAIVLTLISDDNYNRFFQRTLLMQFALTD
jgi:hypothetical protein